MSIVGRVDSFKLIVCENSQSDVFERGSDVIKLLDEGKIEDMIFLVIGLFCNMVNSGGINEEIVYVSGILVESVVLGVVSDKGMEVFGIVEGIDKGNFRDGVMFLIVG